MSETFEPTLIVIGLVLCLFGWTIYWAGLRLLGAICGAVAGAAIAFAVFLFLEEDRWLLPVCGAAAAVGAILGVCIITRAHYFLFFVTGAVFGLGGAWAVREQYPEWFGEHLPEPVHQALYYAGGTLVGGLLLVLAHRVVIIILTAVAGTGLFALGVPWPKYAILAPPLFIGSVLLQTGVLAALGEFRRDEEEDEEE